MSFDADNEILQDFIIEAGEILEDLSENLVKFENNPEDMDILNAIFRSFHTIKGGSGFLALDPLVKICHIIENIFDVLRNHEREVDAELMDAILQGFDVVNDMFSELKSAQYPSDADAGLLAHLESFLQPASQTNTTPTSASAVDQSKKTNTNPAKDDEITEEEFDILLDQVSNENQPSSTANSDAASDEITEDEFEALLDDIHGKGAFSADNSRSTNNSHIKTSSDSNNNPAAGNNNTSSDNQVGPTGDITDEEFETLLNELHSGNKTDNKQPQKTSSKADSDLIDDDEFEALLDELHGAGKAPSSNSSINTSKSSSNSSAGKSASSPAGGLQNNKSQTNQSQTNQSQTAKPVVASSAATSAANPQAASQNKSPAAKPTAQAVGKSPVAAKKTPANITEATVRVDTKRLDDIMNMVGELVLARNRLKTLGQSSADELLTKAIANLDIVTGDLQGAVMKTRMQPIKKVFGRFPRVIRDLARSLKKEINLEMVGEETDLDKNLVEALADPLVHLVRNSVDHGIETPEERVAVGKPRSGTVVLSASQEGDHIILSIEDDGKGMDANLLKNLAIDKGLMDKEQADRLSDSECYNLIFMAGFSTKQEISDISGRGVGMDVVKTKISQLNGNISIESTLGKGTRLSIKVPLTLAILPTLMVKIKEQSFALPLTSVNEIFHLDLTKTNTVDGQLVVVVREKALPLFFLNEWLTRNPHIEERKKDGHVVLVQVGTQRVGFVVDSLIGQEEVVIKPLGKSLHGTPGMAGATITSDGGIALIIDIPSLLRHYAK